MDIRDDTNNAIIGQNEPPKPSGFSLGGLGLHWQILVGMVLGVVLGYSLLQFFPTIATRAAQFGNFGSNLFLRLLTMLVVPLILSSLITGILRIPKGPGLKRMAVSTFAYYIFTSAVAVGVGLLVVNIMRPGDGVNYQDLVSSASSSGIQSPISHNGPSTNSVILDLIARAVPTNIVEAAGSNQMMLSIIVFALFFGFFIRKVSSSHREPLEKFFVALFEVMMKMTEAIVSLAPYGVFCGILGLAASGGLSAFGGLAMYMVTVAVALLVHGVLVLPLLVRFVAGKSPIAFARAMSPALLTAFSTASSNATLPLTIRCATKEANVDESVASFTLPLGATINMDGTALYETVAVFFIAQMLGDLTLGQQVIVAITALAASIGAAGIPHSGLVMMVNILLAAGLPTDAVVIILAVDRALDMCRTSINVWSDACASAIISRFVPKPTDVPTTPVAPT